MSTFLYHDLVYQELINDEAIQEIAKDTAKAVKKVFLIGSPPGSGKSTVLPALLSGYSPTRSRSIDTKLQKVPVFDPIIWYETNKSQDNDEILQFIRGDKTIGMLLNSSKVHIITTVKWPLNLKPPKSQIGEYLTKEQQVSRVYSKQLLRRFLEYVLSAKYLLSLLRKIITELVRLQCVASQIHNRVSLSPSPQRREPPIGGVKIGGGFQFFSVMLPRNSTFY